MQWDAWADGTAAPNPGRMGIGVLLAAPDGERQEYSRALPGSGCNNEAEVRAIAAALSIAEAAGAKRLRVHSDSRFAVDCLTGRDNTVIPHLARLLAETVAAFAAFEEVALVWHPRHRNGEADRLARAALGLAAKPVTRNDRRKRQRR